MNVFQTFLKGIIIGIGNIIPGVSGGTLALVLGIYQRLIQALNNISGDTFKALMNSLSMKAEARKKLSIELQRIDAFFLMALGSGAILAVGVFSKLIAYLLLQHHDPTYGFFMGLILFSIIVPYQMLKTKTLGGVVAGILALVLVYGLANVQTGDEKLTTAKRKYEIKQAKEQESEKNEQSTVNTDLQLATPTHDLQTFFWFFLAGAIAISAMILPGISGSFLMILLGVYFELLASISQFDVMILVVFALGCGIGLLVFTKLLNFVLDRFHDLTMCFLIGLMAGSLIEIWPFKNSEQVGDTTIYLENVFPISCGENELMATIFFLVGGAIILGFIAFEKKKAKSV